MFFALAIAVPIAAAVAPAMVVAALAIAIVVVSAIAIVIVIIWVIAIIAAIEERRGQEGRNIQATVMAAIFEAPATILEFAEAPAAILE